MSIAFTKKALRLRLSLVILALLLPLGPAVRAILFDPLSIETMTSQADIVLHGTVLSKTCQRDPAGRIFTRVELQVIDVWKGAISGSPFPIVQGGGVLGEQQTVVSGQARYEIGEEVVAFLVRNPRGEGVTLGLMQGKFHVWKEAVTGVRFVAHPFHTAPEQAKVRPQNASGGGIASGRLELRSLRERVQEVAR